MLLINYMWIATLPLAKKMVFLTKKKRTLLTNGFFMMVKLLFPLPMKWIMSLIFLPDSSSIMHFCTIHIKNLNFNTLNTHTWLNSRGLNVCKSIYIFTLASFLSHRVHFQSRKNMKHDYIFKANSESISLLLKYIFLLT